MSERLYNLEVVILLLLFGTKYQIHIVQINQQYDQIWPYGQIPTEAVCSASASGGPDTATQGEYCWCRATGLTTTDDVFHAAPNAPWTFGVRLASYDSCNAQCSGEVCRRFKANESRREAMYKGDLDTPACVEKTYMVQYIPNGGTITPTDPRFFYTATSSSVGKPTSISKTGYTFAGWCESEEDANDANIISCQMETNVQPSDRQDKTFYAKWIEVPTEPEFECASKAWLHIDQDKVCLSKIRPDSSPVFAVQTAKDKYYLQVHADPSLRINKDTTKKWHLDYNGTIYNIHDETVSGNSGNNSNSNDENGSGDDGNDSNSDDGTVDNVTSLRQADTSINGTGLAYLMTIRGNEGYSGARRSDYGLTNAGDWGVTFPYGKVVGTSLCSSTEGIYATTGYPNETNAENNGNCWCKLTKFIPNTGSQENISSSQWVFRDNVSFCPGCSGICANMLNRYSTDPQKAIDFRTALFNSY